MSRTTPAMPRSASVWGRNPCACAVTAASVRWRSRATAKAPAPTPTAGRSSNTLPASRQYLPRVEEDAKTRAPPSSGDTSVSLVSRLTRSSMFPERATEVKATSGTRQASATATTPARRRVRIDTRPRCSPTLIAKPVASSKHRHQDDEQPEVARHGLLGLERLEALREWVLGQRPGADRAAGERRDDDHREAAQAQRHDREPQGRRNHRGGQRPPRLRQQDGKHAQADRRVGECAPPHAAGSPRAEPQRERDRDRRDGAHRVPILEGRADAVRELVLRERARARCARRASMRPAASRPSEDADDHAWDRARREPRPGDGGGEHDEVGERPARLDVAQLGDDRPEHRERRQHGEQCERHKARGAIQRAAPAPQQGGGDHADAGEHHRDFGDAGPAQLRPAGRPEGDRGEGGAEYQRERATGVS